MSSQKSYFHQCWQMNSVSTSLRGSYLKKGPKVIVDELLDCCQQYPNEIEQILLLGLKKNCTMFCISKKNYFWFLGKCKQWYRFSSQDFIIECNWNFFNWDTLHARLSSHCKAWSYKKKKKKKEEIKAYRKSLLQEPTVNRCLLILDLQPYRS